MLKECVANDHWKVARNCGKKIVTPLELYIVAMLMQLSSFFAVVVVVDTVDSVVLMLSSSSSLSVVVVVCVMLYWKRMKITSC